LPTTEKIIFFIFQRSHQLRTFQKVKSISGGCQKSHEANQEASFASCYSSLLLMSTHGFRAFESTSRLGAREQTDEERYGIPENFLEIEVKNPQTHGKF
jgi:hypothetical protein